jgi:hypothetical protein
MVHDLFSDAASGNTLAGDTTDEFPEPGRNKRPVALDRRQALPSMRISPSDPDECSAGYAPTTFPGGEVNEMSRLH